MTSSSPAVKEADHDGLTFVAQAADRWDDAVLAAALLAIDPEGLRGAVIAAGPGPVRDQWLALFAMLSADRGPLVPVPSNADEGQLLGGLDLVETLASSRPISRRGLLPSSDQRTLLVRMAERLNASAANALAGALDDGATRIERDGFSERHTARVAAIFLDEGGCEDSLPGALEDRSAFLLNLDGIPMACTDEETELKRRVDRARVLYPSVTVDDETALAIGAACLSTGVTSLRVQMACTRAARGLAALGQRETVSPEDARTAVRLVVAPRATSLPAADTDQDVSAEETPGTDEPSDEQMQEPSRGDEAEPPPDDGEREALSDESLHDIVSEAIRSGAVSLSAAGFSAPAASKQYASGKAGDAKKSKKEGRPVGSEPGDPRRGGRLDILATLRSAAPWQRLRPPPSEGSGVRIYPTDLRIRKFSSKTASSVIFVVDASGSSAMHRLAEAKGAVENLLLECYARRDLVGLIAFKGSFAECVLPPCRSLARARRAMAGLPGGGGTPLASAIELAVTVAGQERAEGRAPLLVFLTDGQANVARDGTPGRPQASADVEELAPLVAYEGFRTLFFDTALRPSDRAKAVAHAMGATYIPLPYADGTTVSAAVRAEQQHRDRQGTR